MVSNNKRKTCLFVLLSLTVVSGFIFSAHYVHAFSFWDWLLSIVTGSSLTGYASLDTCELLPDAYLFTSEGYYECTCPYGAYCAAKVDTSAFDTQPELSFRLSLSGNCNNNGGDFATQIYPDEDDIGVNGMASGSCSQRVAYKRNVGEKYMSVTISGGDEVNVVFAITETGEDCEAYNNNCHNGDLYLFDTCGEPLELVEECDHGCSWQSDLGSYGCDPAPCTDDCSQDERECVDDNSWRGCGEAADGDSCLDWMTPGDCLSTQICVDGECVGTGPVCGDGYCDSGEDCEDDDCCGGSDTNLQTSDIHCGSCWNTCTSDESCSSGQCVEDGLSCSDECNSGSTGCSSLTQRWYCSEGTDGCNDQLFEDCTSGKQCSGGVCSSPGLLPNGDDCTSGSQCQSGNCDDVCCDAGESCCDSNSDCGTGEECGDEHYCIDSGDDPCPSTCNPSYIGDNDCDEACNIAACNFDEGDCENNLLPNGRECIADEECESDNCRGVCCEDGERCCQDNSDCAITEECKTNYHYCWAPPGRCSSGCGNEDLGDGSCDTYCNNIECEWDMGDCPVGEGCNNDGFCDSSLGEDCNSCDDCSCTIYQCCAPDSDNADSRGCVAPTDSVAWNSLCCDGGVYEALGKTCDEILEVQLKPDGSACSSSDECQSDNCNNDICCSYGQTCCKSSSSCSSDQYCLSSNYCRDKENEGETCNRHIECKSGICDLINLVCTVEEEKMGLGEACEWSDDCDPGLKCKKAKVKETSYCCPSGNDYCCHDDYDCTENTANRDYYCYGGNDHIESKRFSCQPYSTASSGGSSTVEPRRLSEQEKKQMGESCSTDSDCWTDHCANGICCHWGKCCNVNSDCSDGVCYSQVHRCVNDDIDETSEDNRNAMISQRTQTDHIEDTTVSDLGLETNFYVATPTTEGKGIVGKRLGSVLVVANKGDEAFYVKAKINQRDTHIDNAYYDISNWDPEKETTWLESVPIINWLIHASKKLNTWLWESVQEMWLADDEGFYKIPPGTLLAVQYAYEPTSVGDYWFNAEIKYYTEMGDEYFSYVSSTNTYSTTTEKNIITESFEKRIQVKEPDCGALGLVCR